MMAIESRSGLRPWLAMLVLGVTAFAATLPGGWLPGRVLAPKAVFNRDGRAAPEVLQVTHAADYLRAGEPPLWDPSSGLGEYHWSRVGLARCRR